MNTELRTTNAFYREIGKFSIFNARIGFDTQDGFALSVFANNLFNTYGLNRVASATGVPDYYVSSRPRTLGVNARKSF